MGELFHLIVWITILPFKIYIFNTKTYKLVIKNNFLTILNIFFVIKNYKFDTNIYNLITTITVLKRYTDNLFSLKYNFGRKNTINIG
jgi:hypothetical protein